MSEPFVGEIKSLGFNFAPRGYMLCAGQLLPLTQNQALFALLGTIYGGNGTTNFGLPDLRGRVALGWGSGPGLHSYAIGEMAGTETTTLTISNMPAHNHTAAFVPTGSSLSATTTINALIQPASRQPSPANGFLTGGQDAGGAVVNNYATQGTPATLAAGAATTTLTGGVTGTVTVGVTGGSLPVNNLQPFLSITYAIATVGIYPSRS